MDQTTLSTISLLEARLLRAEHLLFRQLGIFGSSAGEFSVPIAG